MCQYSNRSQMTSECSKKKKLAQYKPLGKCVTVVLTTSRCLLWSITEQMEHGNMKSIWFMQWKEKVNSDVIQATVLQ